MRRPAAAQLSEHPPEPAGLMRVIVDRRDDLRQRGTPGRRRQERALPARPRVVSDARDPEQTSHQLDRVVGLLRVYQRELLAHR